MNNRVCANNIYHRWDQVHVRGWKKRYKMYDGKASKGPKVDVEKRQMLGDDLHL